MASTPDRAVPPTAEELRERLTADFASAFIRIRGAHNPNPGEPCAWCRLAAEQAAEAMVTADPLRALLDAARAIHPDALAALREDDLGPLLSFADTLATMLEVLPPGCDVDEEGRTCTRHNAEWTPETGCEWADGLQAIALYQIEARAVRAALAAADTAPAPLDVERLAAALNIVRPYGGNPSEWAKVGAARIASEYVRLSQPSKEPTDG